MKKIIQSLLCACLSAVLLLCSGCLPKPEERLTSDAHDYYGSYVNPVPFGEELEIQDSKLTYTLKIDQTLRGKQATKYVAVDRANETTEYSLCFLRFLSKN